MSRILPHGLERSMGSQLFCIKPAAMISVTPIRIRIFATGSLMRCLAEGAWMVDAEGDAATLPVSGGSARAYALTGRGTILSPSAIVGVIVVFL